MILLPRYVSNHQLLVPEQNNDLRFCYDCVDAGNTEFP